jgi:hypothetical protein
LEKSVGLAEEDFGEAGFVEEFEGALHARGVLLNLDGIAGVSGEHEELAERHLVLNLFSEFKAIFFGHGDVAKEEARSEGASAGETIGGRVSGFGVVAVRFEDECKSIGN